MNKKNRRGDIEGKYLQKRFYNKNMTNYAMVRNIQMNKKNKTD